VRGPAGPQYARGAAWCFFYGQHYRAIWATPVTAPVLRLATAVPGGLVPLQAGGSYQSHTLRLRAPSGAQYNLRSVDKDGSAALPAGWRRWLLGGLLRDQTSAGQPFGAYVAARLAETAGVYHTNPRLIYLADDALLGPYRARFANALYLLEERPEGNQQGQACFGHSPLVLNSAHLLAALRRSPAAQIDARAYLRARLLDMWLGDWSRREDQWRWASFPRAGGRTSYRPIPRDRDQAFFMFDDGLLTQLVAWVVPKYHSFHAAIPLGSVNGLTITARALDRTLLATLSADDFRQEADSLRRRLTNAAVAAALTAGPPETRARLAARLGPMLLARRAQLPAVAQRYHALLAAEAWLIGTDQPERFVLRAAGPGRLRVQVFASRPAAADTLVADRTYDQHITQRLDLYGLGGNDRFELQGPLPTAMPVHIYCGAGRDEISSPRNMAPGSVIWHLRAGSAPRVPPAGVLLVPDPHPELTTDGTAWMKRYNLHD